LGQHLLLGFMQLLLLLFWFDSEPSDSDEGEEVLR
jgi:hypothetical protein